MSKKKETVGESYTDRWGTPIKPHCYLADNGGRVYMVNSHYQAVPQDENAPAVELSVLLQDEKVRVLKPEEVLKFNKPGSRGNAMEILDEEAERRKREENTAVNIVLQAVPDTRLADELRRRGYHVTAVKPALIEI
ncbi:MAG: hypothetical protein IJ884_05660 [Bacteroidales bacterium]|nr:hypothetical protein [Bacteroidales bacterium]